MRVACIHRDLSRAVVLYSAGASRSTKQLPGPRDRGRRRWGVDESEIGHDEITYVEEGRIVEKNLPARASFFLKRLGERRTYLRFHAKWLSDPGPPREMTAAVLADYKLGLETIKTLCEKP